MVRKMVLLVGVATFAASTAFAQMDMNPLGLQPAAKQTSKGYFGNLSVGFGTNSLATGYGDAGPTMMVSYDHQVSDVFSLGAALSHSSSTYSYGYYGGTEYGYKYSVNTIGVRGSYHLRDLIDDQRADLYTGGTLSYSTVSAKVFGGNQEELLAQGNFAWVGGFAGGRYFFRPSVGGFLELGYNYTQNGYSYANANLGLTFRF